MTNDECALCGIEELPHLRAEQAGTMHHRWSPEGKLVQVSLADKKPARKGTQPILVVGAIDTTLRQLLVDKGILSYEDLAPVLGSGPSSTGDSSDRETPPAQ